MDRSKLKEIDEMSHVEILALTPDEVEFLCDYECAKAGVKLVTRPKEPEQTAFEPDRTVYKVFDFCSEDKTVITEIAAFIVERRSRLCKTDYEWRTSRDQKFIKESLRDYDYTAEVSSERVFSPEKYDSLKTQMADRAQKQSHYESAKREYDEHLEKREKICSQLMSIIRAHKQLADRETEYDKIFQKYLRLANGDVEVAGNFYRKTVEDGEFGDVERYLIEKSRKDHPEGFDLGKLRDAAINWIANYD